MGIFDPPDPNMSTSDRIKKGLLGGLGPAGWAIDALSSTPPKAPDLTGAAEKTAAANRPNTNTPFGYSNWKQGPDGSWDFTTGLDPSLQGSYDQFTHGLQGGEAARQSATDSIYGQEMSRLNPMWDQRQQSMQSQLVNQGLDQGSEAYRRAQDDFGRSRNDAYQGAMNNAVAGGQQAAMQNYQLNMGGLQGLRGLMSPFGFMPGADYLGAAGAQGKLDLDRWAAEQKQQADTMKGIGQVGAAGFGV